MSRGAGGWASGAFSERSRAGSRNVSGSFGRQPRRAGAQHPSGRARAAAERQRAARGPPERLELEWAQHPARGVSRLGCQESHGHGAARGGEADLHVRPSLCAGDADE
eukprot:scaffold803_cov310-Pinguiococcus_pyrenoidosus.AAC.130